MNDTILPIDEPRLTAYALGELTDPAHLAAIEALLRDSAAARAEVAEIRTLATSLVAEYDQERGGDSGGGRPANVIALPPPKPPGNRFRWSAAAWSVAAAVAVLAVLVGLSRPTLPFRPKVGSPAITSAGKHDLQPAVEESAAPIPASPSSPGAAATPLPSVLLAQTHPSAPPQTFGASLTMGELSLLANEQSKALPEEAESKTRRLATEAGVVSSNDRQEAPANFDSSSRVAGKEVPAAVAQRGKSQGQSDIKNEAKPILAAKEFNRPARAFASTAPASLPSAGSTSRPSVVLKPNVINQPVFATRAGQDAHKPVDFDGFIQYGAPNQMVDSAAAAPQVAGGTASSSKPASGPAAMAGLAVGGTFGWGGAQAALSQSIAQRDGTELQAGLRSPGGTAAYEHRAENAFLAARDNPLSTFSVDVDTASYSNVRRFIEQGNLPPPDAVRIEEMLNYFPYSDAPPAEDNPRPFAIHLEAAACPWAPEHRLVRIGIKGREMAADRRPASNLVFLVDVSGSMTPPERLPLVKESLRLMTEKLGDNDRVGIVVYAGESGVALPSTTGDHKDVILAALGALHPGGSTNGAAGITLAYQIAQEHFIKGGVNRVILATDGDFNVGVTSRDELVRLIEKQAKSGIFLSVLGVGTDNLQDATMQRLADRGNGNYAYLDSVAEGKKVLVEQMSGTLVTIAKDVKIQVEFNPAAVSAYRLIGYEKRALRNEDFNNDKIDAGEIGAGPSVTALYEVAPAGQPVPGTTPGVDPLKYSADSAPDKPTPAPETKPVTAELLTVKMRHKAPDGDKSERSYEEALVDRGAPGEYANASADFKFSAAVASFGMVLRDSGYKGNATLESAAELAQEGKGPDASGYRAGFIELTRKAQALRRSMEAQ